MKIGSPESIVLLIQLSLLAVTATGCDPATEDDDNADSDDCPELSREPFEVLAWDLTPEGFAELTAAAAQENRVWSEMDDVSKCELVCAYAGGMIDAYLDPYYDGSGDAHYVYADTCTLTVVVEADMVIGGGVTCAGELASGPTCI